MGLPLFIQGAFVLIGLLLAVCTHTRKHKQEIVQPLCHPLKASAFQSTSDVILTASTDPADKILPALFGTLLESIKICYPNGNTSIQGIPTTSSSSVSNLFL